MITLNTGRKGSGKTTRTLNIITGIKKPVIIFDVQGEYKEDKNTKVFTSFDFSFIISKIEKSINTFFVIEEAKIFFSFFDEEKAARFLISQRHKGNDFIFNFHSIRMMPLYIIDHTDYIILGKTNDLPMYVRTKYADTELLRTFNKIKSVNNEYFYKIIKL